MSLGGVCLERAFYFDEDTAEPLCMSFCQRPELSVPTPSERSAPRKVKSSE
jgi:hypothetical protein